VPRRASNTVGGGAAAQCVEVSVNHGRLSNGKLKAALTPKHFRISVWRLSHRLRVVTACERLPSYDFFAKERICSTKPSFFARRSWRRSPDCPAPLASAATMFGVQQQHAPGHVLCCMCGMGIPPNPAGMCVDCIRSQVRRPAAEISKRASPPKTHGRATHPTRETGDERVLSFSSVCGRAASARATARPSFSPRAPRVDPPTALVRRD
jgi:hypothetical protein